jgi:hypothetical protein
MSGSSRFGSISLAAAIAIGLSSLLVIAAETPPAPPTPEQQAMMEAYMRAATPGEHHAHHARAAGTWKATVSFWPAAGAPADQSMGQATLVSTMDNRYLHEEFTGTAGGQPFRGAGLSGYDNVTGRHWSMWVDSMSTGPAMSWGTCEPGHKVINFKGEMPDATTGKLVPFRAVSRHVSDDRVVYEMYGKGKDGKEYKSLEVVYDRQR